MVDVFEERIYPARVVFKKRIVRIERLSHAPKRYILPGLVDAHNHIESSMLIPSEYARVAIRHGTASVVSDPHEIANVLGMRGVRFMMDDAKRSPMKFHFGASPCVPATGFETSGSRLGAREIGSLLRMKRISHLSEVMDYPGVIAREPGIMRKIGLAKRYGKRIDGHAPGVKGRDLDRYISAGITTDHECSALDEAVEKAGKGMMVIVREGSAARNLEELCPMLMTDKAMLCSDDLECPDLIEGHMDSIIRKAVRLGAHPLNAIIAATRRPVEHYGLDSGLLRENDPADISLFSELTGFRAMGLWIDGKKVSDGKRSFSNRKKVRPINIFRIAEKSVEDFRTPDDPVSRAFAIKAKDGELITEKMDIRDADVPDTGKDILKIAVINRYREAPVSIGFINGFGLRKGAIGSSVMHDSHNVCVVGADDQSICRTANCIIRMKGALAVYDTKRMAALPLPYAGLMSGCGSGEVAERHRLLHGMARKMGCRMRSPFMTLSFMALLVIPHIKISDKGLFDGDRFSLM